MKIKIDTFRGLVPKLAPGLLPDGAAQIASQARLTTGSLAPINSPKFVSSKLNTAATSVFMLGASGSQIPLSWAADVDVAPSPVSDTEYKVYYTGDSVPKKTSYTLANGAGPYPADWYHMGTPAPTATPTVAATAGSVPAGTYIYLFTYVTTFGGTLKEESAPSPASAPITLGAPGGVTVANLLSPTVLTNRNYTHKRIYRTIGSAYQMVAEVPLATVSYTDTLSATQIAGDALLTATWTPPPDGLKGLCALPGGNMFGFKDNEIWFCEPGIPHAWPRNYMQTVDSQIVGAKAFGSTIVVATITVPFIAAGQHPTSFTFQRVPLPEPCVSKRSVVADGEGVMYASKNGLVSVSNGGANVVTLPYISRSTFVAYNPASFRSCVFDGRYYGFFDMGGTAAGALVFSRGSETPVSTVAYGTNGTFIDFYTARMLVIDPIDNFLYEFDPDSGVPFTYQWKSKLFQLPAPANLGCFRLRTRNANLSDDLFTAELAAANAATLATNTTLIASNTVASEVNVVEANLLELNGSYLKPQQGAIPKTVGVTVWADGNIIFNRSVALNTVQRLPSGFLARDWEIGVSGQREVYAVEMATSPTELAEGING